MIYSLYRAAAILGSPLIAAYLGRRLKRGKEDPLRFGERMGLAAMPRPAGPVVWLHGASVGEALSMLPVIERLAAHPAGPKILVTTGTVTSAKLMAERLPASAVHQYVPVDRPAWVARFLDHWRPDIALWWESELWPNLVIETKRRRIPMLMANARMSPRSFKKWQRFPGFADMLIAAFDAILTQSDIDTERFRALGGQAETLGNLKFAVPPLPADPERLSGLQAAISGRPVWLAASTHAGEEAACWRAHRIVSEKFPNLLSIIVPRHADRGQAIAAALGQAGARVARRAIGEQPGPDIDVYIADTMGELGVFFRAAPIVFMGKSLLPQGGQNPIEPARLGTAIISGPHTWNFEKIVADLQAAGGIRIVADDAELAVALAADLADPAAATGRALAAKRHVEAAAEVLDTFMDRIDPMLIRLGKPEPTDARP